MMLRASTHQAPTACDDASRGTIWYVAGRRGAPTRGRARRREDYRVRERPPHDPLARRRSGLAAVAGGRDKAESRCARRHAPRSGGTPVACIASPWPGIDGEQIAFSFRAAGRAATAAAVKRSRSTHVLAAPPPRLPATAPTAGAAAGTATFTRPSSAGGRDALVHLAFAADGLLAGRARDRAARAHQTLPRGGRRRAAARPGAHDRRRDHRRRHNDRPRFDATPETADSRTRRSGSAPT